MLLVVVISTALRIPAVSKRNTTSMPSSAQRPMRPGRGASMAPSVIPVSRQTNGEARNSEAWSQRGVGCQDERVGILSHWPLILLLLVASSPLYFLPSFVAIARKHQVGMVIVLNAFLGWTLMGWVVALAIAFGALAVAQQPAVLGAAPQLSPDGRYYWDGLAWQPWTPPR